jgi:pyridoxal phosphate enzyme (YggS family)
MISIANNIKKVKEEIARAASRAGLNPDRITVVAVSKTRTPEEITKAILSGISHIGENRVQEAADKIPKVPHTAAWHMVGPLQSNKIRKAAGLFDWVDTVDSRAMADKLAAYALEMGRNPNVLIQVNISREQVKSGIEPGGAADLAGYMTEKPPLRLRGLMMIGTYNAGEDVMRKEFAQMRRLFESIRGVAGPHAQFDTLSMGMSGDYAIAVEEGATMVRLGTVIFGPRA